MQCKIANSICTECALLMRTAFIIYSDETLCCARLREKMFISDETVLCNCISSFVITLLCLREIHRLFRLINNKNCFKFISHLCTPPLSFSPCSHSVHIYVFVPFLRICTTKNLTHKFVASSTDQQNHPTTRPTPSNGKWRNTQRIRKLQQSRQVVPLHPPPITPVHLHVHMKILCSSLLCFSRALKTFEWILIRLVRASAPFAEYI